MLSYQLCIKNDRKKVNLNISQLTTITTWIPEVCMQSTVLVFGVATWQQLHVVVYYGYFVSFYSELQIACIQYDYNIMPIYL